MLLAGLLLLSGSGSLAASPNAPAACVPGPHSGHIAADETWCLADSPHQMTGDVTVDAGVALTIEAGVTINVANSKALHVAGDLLALSTAAQPILFTSAENDDAPQWSGIYFEGGTGHLQHVTVRYTSRSIGFMPGVVIKVSDTAAGQVLIEDCVLEKNGGGWGEEYGLHVSNGVVTMKDTTIREIGGGGGQDAAVFITGGDSDVTLSGNHLVNNTRDVVALASGAMMNHDATLAKQAEMDAYVLRVDYYHPNFIVPAGITLTIEPGVTVKGHNWNTYLLVHGHLQALGTATEPIIFTSEADSDRNQWGGLYFDGGTGDLQHVVVRNGCNADPRADITVANTGAGQVRIRDSELRSIGNHWGDEAGLFIDNGHVTMTNTLFSDIGGGGGVDAPIRIKGPDSQVTLTDNRLENNNVRNLIILRDNALANHDATLTPQIGQEAYYFRGDYTLAPSATLTIAPGTVLEMGADAAMWVQGNLQAVGTSAQRILFTSKKDDANNAWSGLRFTGGAGHLRYVDVRYGNTWRPDGRANVNIEVSDTPAGEQVLIQNSRIEHAAKWANQFGLLVDNGHVRVENTLFRDLGVFGYGNAGEAALKVRNGGEAHLIHTTFTENQNRSVAVDGASTAFFTNTIIANSYLGLKVDAGGQVQMAQTLWDNNNTHIDGVVTEVGHLEGQAAFDLDGYHLTEFSAALGQGVDAGLNDDIDGEARPQPAGSQPDLGADEFSAGPTTGATAEKTAFEPQWVYEANAVGLPKSHLRQRYLIRLFNDEAAAQDYSVTDTLPEGFHVTEEKHNLPMAYTRAEPTLNWVSQQPLAQRGVADILLTTASRAMETYTNRAEAHIGAQVFDLEATAETPIIPPLITRPVSWTHCPASVLGGAITVEGASQSNAIVRLYENGEEVATANADADGYFHIEYPSERVGVDDLVTLTARTCSPEDPNRCGELSQPVELTPWDGYWCGQASSWNVPAGRHQGAYRFLPGQMGGASVIGPRHFDASVVSFYVPGEHQEVVLIVGHDAIQPISPIEPPSYKFPVPPTPPSLCLRVDGHSICVGLIDPDGYVFDVTKGFDPDHPSLNAVQGVTVTCMVNIPEWGGWTVWPAELYDNQINPQVTGAEGYFSFYTPPGDYYLQVDAIDGYQSWRSPVIHVVDDIVHVNAPYTPLPAGALSARVLTGVGRQVLLTVEGPEPKDISIDKGDWIEWKVPQDPEMTPEERMMIEDHPVLHPLSDLDPIASTDGWDGGMMTPDQRYLRQFDSAGDFSYTDGAGHKGTIHVTGDITAWRFRGFTCRGPVAHPYDGDAPCADGEPLGGVTLRLLGQDEGDPQPVFEKAVTTDESGFFNFYMIQPWIYDIFTLTVAPPTGLVAADAWSADGTALDAGTIQWRDAGPWVHKNTFYFDAPTPTPTPTLTPTPTSTPTLTPTPTPTPVMLYLPIITEH
jgi:hypothetical protein